MPNQSCLYRKIKLGAFFGKQILPPMMNKVRGFSYDHLAGDVAAAQQIYDKQNFNEYQELVEGYLNIRAWYSSQYQNVVK